MDMTEVGDQEVVQEENKYSDQKVDSLFERFHVLPKDEAEGLSPKIKRSLVSFALNQQERPMEAAEMLVGKDADKWTEEDRAMIREQIPEIYRELIPPYQRKKFGI